MSDPDIEKLRSDVDAVAPHLSKSIHDLLQAWTRPLLGRLGSLRPQRLLPKTFNDPIWGTIELTPWETMILDSPLMQRLRGVRQLGMAHHVYPSAGYDRLEHCRGVVAAAQRMIESLARNAESRRIYEREDAIPKVEDEDLTAIRLAALVHDIGHGPFSHATEDIIERNFLDELDQVRQLLVESFDGAEPPAVSEALAVLMVLSRPFDEVLLHPKFEIRARRAELAGSIAARLLGARNFLRATYLSGVVSGPIDADKLDYMARDCHHSGLPLGLDTNRLIDKLEVITLLPSNVPAAQPELLERVRSAPSQKYHELGISASGLTAYEQLVIARVMLYDRLYHHHKVRCAEAMIRRMYQLRAEERKSPFMLQEFFVPYSDDAVLNILCAELSSEKLKLAQSSHPKALYEGFLHHDLFCRAFAFAPRFVAGLDGLSPEESSSTREKILRPVFRDLGSVDRRRELEALIHTKATELVAQIPAFSTLRGEPFGASEVIIDIPKNKSVAHRADNLLMRSVGGGVSTPNLYFDPSKWSIAYETQKRCSYVFCPRRFVSAVALASRIVFAETYGFTMGDAAHWAAKTSDLVDDALLESAFAGRACSKETLDLLRNKRTRLIAFRPQDIQAPPDFRNENPGLVDRLSNELNAALPSGLPYTEHSKVLDAMKALMLIAPALNRAWPATKPDERQDLQRKVRELLEQHLPVTEGQRLGGGETDLILHNTLVLENKVLPQPTDSPHSAGPNFEWQLRRYSIEISSRVGFQLVAYQPSSENGLLSLSDRISVIRQGSPEERAVIRIVAPFGQGVPSSATRPQDL